MTEHIVTDGASATAAERDVVALVVKYANTVDEGDWAGFASCFADEVDIRMPEVTGTVGVMTSDEWVAACKKNTGCFAGMMHYMTNFAVTIAGDEATCWSHLYAVNYYALGPAFDALIVMGVYKHSARLTASGWRLVGVELDRRVMHGSVPDQWRPRAR
jgi:hypothetical protein